MLFKYKKFQLSKHKIQTQLRCHPRIYLTIQSLRRKTSHLVVTKDTDIVIEGFPRSANSFAVYAFRLAQDSLPNPNLKIAHHLHASAQIKRAVKLNIPIILLLRNPKDAVLSVVIKAPFITFNQALKDYIKFYSSIVKLSKKYVLATFEDVTNDFGKVIEKVNKFYNKQFKIFNHNDENVEKCFNIMNNRGKSLYDNDPTKYSVPSKQKQEIKKTLEYDFNKNVDMVLYGRASKIYNELIDLNK